MLHSHQREIHPLKHGVNQACAGFMLARRVAEPQGGLPSVAFRNENVLHDYASAQGAMPFWTRDIVAYPSSGSVFIRGVDLRDTSIGWRVPANYLKDTRLIREDIFKKRGIALLIEPAQIDPDRNGAVIHPKAIILLENFLQRSGIGIANAETGIPKHLNDEGKRLYQKEKEVPSHEVCRFDRFDSLGVRPIVVHSAAHIAAWWPDKRAWVAYSPAQKD